METGIINGFILWEKAFEKNNVAIVFPCCKNSIPRMAVSIYSLLKNMNRGLNYDIIIISKNFDEIDLSRLQSMAQDYSNVKIRIAGIKNLLKMPYINIDTCLDFEDGILLFLPFILKRYSEVIAVSCGTIFSGNFNVGGMSEKDMICYTERESEILAVKYNLERCRNCISPKVVADISREKPKGSIFGMLKEIYMNNFETDSSNSVFLCAGNNGQFNNIFLEYAKNTYYYEKLLYSITGTADLRKTIVGERYYLFPFERVKQGSSIVLYGAGKVGKQYSRQLQLSKYCKIAAIVDSKYEWYQRRGEQVQDITFLLEGRYDFVVIAIANEAVSKSVEKDLISMKVEPEKIIALTGRELEV